MQPRSRASLRYPLRIHPPSPTRPAPLPPTSQPRAENPRQPGLTSAGRPPTPAIASRRNCLRAAVLPGGPALRPIPPVRARPAAPPPHAPPNPRRQPGTSAMETSAAAVATPTVLNPLSRQAHLPGRRAARHVRRALRAAAATGNRPWPPAPRLETASGLALPPGRSRGQRNADECGPNLLQLSRFGKKDHRRH